MHQHACQVSRTACMHNQEQAMLRTCGYVLRALGATSATPVLFTSVRVMLAVTTALVLPRDSTQVALLEKVRSWADRPKPTNSESRKAPAEEPASCRRCTIESGGATCFRTLTHLPYSRSTHSPPRRCRCW